MAVGQEQDGREGKSQNWAFTLCCLFSQLWCYAVVSGGLGSRLPA